MAKKNDALALWDQQLADEAKANAAAVAALDGVKSFSIRSGVLKYGEDEIPGNEIVVMIIGSAFENSYYTGDFDPDQMSSPDCYARSTTHEDLAPHAEAADPQAQTCGLCEWNRFGSADKGRGKACKNRIRLMCLAAGTNSKKNGFDPFGPEEIKTADAGVLAVPPTSTKAWAKYVKAVATLRGKGVLGVYTKVRVVPDPKTQIALVFEDAGLVKGNVGVVAMERRVELNDQLTAAMPRYEDEEPKKKSKKKGSKKKSKVKRRKFA